MSNTFTLPIYWTKKYKTKPDKTVLVGMNWYRNAYYRDQNNMKTEFTALLEAQTLSIKKVTKFKLYMKLYYKTASCDPSNIVALTEKIALDSFKKYSIIIDDNVKFHLGTTWSVAGQDKDNPRVEISIIEADQHH